MQEKVIFRPVAPEEVPALVKLRLQTRIETYSEIYPREWIEEFDVAASEERFCKIAADPDQRLCFIEVDGACAGYLCFGREMEKTMPENSALEPMAMAMPRPMKSCRPASTNSVTFWLANTGM